MSFPISIFLIPYGLFLLFFFLFAFFNLYHIIKFGLRSMFGLVSIGIFCLGVYFILISSLAAISQINWDEIIILST